MFAKICFCLVNLWLWVSTAEGFPVNHALADFLHHDSDTNSLLTQNNNVRFESQRYFPRYKPILSYPVFDVRSRSTLKQGRDGAWSLPSTTPLSVLSFGFSAETSTAQLLPNEEATTRVRSTDSNTQNFPTTTIPTTPLFGEILSMRVSTSVTNSHRPGEAEEKPLVRESTTELYHESTVKPAEDLHNTVLDTQTTQRNSIDTSSANPGTLGIIAYYNVDSTQTETTTSAELVKPNDLTKSITMDYYAYQNVGHDRIGKSSSDYQTQQDGQQEESRPVTTRVLLEYLPTTEASYRTPETSYGKSETSYRTPETSYGTPEVSYGTPKASYEIPEGSYRKPDVSYGKPEENYEVSEEDSVRSNGRIHGIQSTPSTTTSSEKTFQNSDEAKAEADRRKSSYVVEGRNYKKYRVEEETSDGFIVGEYGVVSHNDGSMRGVRYTAESNINPRLIYHALLKFLSLQ